MSKPKNMTPEQEAAWREKERARRKARYEANKDICKERDKAYYEANKERRKERRKAYREANKERRKERDKAYREANKGKLAAKARAKVEKMPDFYITNLLKISVAECPPELIEMKRQQILIHRSIKQLQTKLEKQNGN